MLSLFKRFCQDESGPTAVEYAVLVVFIALAIAVGANILGANLSILFSNIGATLGAAKVPSL